MFFKNKMAECKIDADSCSMKAEDCTKEAEDSIKYDPVTSLISAKATVDRGYSAKHCVSCTNGIQVI